MKNKNGFVMTETLVVIVFLVSIFTFVYISIVPLLGRYEDLVYRKSDIDIVYKLYHVRKMLEVDPNRSMITSSGFNNITCDDFDDFNYCNKLMEYLGLNDYLLVYTDNIIDDLSNFENLNKDMYDYISNYQDLTEKYLVLLDTNKHTIAHLAYYGN